NKRLSAKQKKLLKDWIRQGAEYAEPWSYSAPVKHAEPKLKNSKWARNFVDRRVLERLESEGLAPSPEADRVTLIRRLTFDLTGLPPTTAEVESFLADKSADAYEKRVDRLLASPRFGERMAAYWLDLVRYADTVGYHGDQDHNVSPYRDWVIDAFNQNMPYDKFTSAQLAGDLVAKANPKLSADEVTDLKIASCYTRLLQTSHEGGVQPKEYLAIYQADRIRNVSNVWMGATVGCAQCHDHKFDPYTLKDFYALGAFFADIDEAQHFKGGGNILPTKRPPEIAVLTAPERRAIASAEKQLVAVKKQLTAKPNDAELKKQIDALAKQIADMRKKKRMVMISHSIKPRTIRVLPRGNWLDDSGEVVEPAVPHFLPQPAVKDRRLTRLDLANWLTSTKEDGVGGLTARVAVNRMWYLTFGTGIARVLDDFGGQGEPPVHPELLDELALEFIKHDWDVKHMFRLLVTSSAYRQSSLMKPGLMERDPENRLYARQSRYRLPAEMIRDNALAISGLLVDELGGASVKPFQPAGYYRHLNFPNRRYQKHSDERQWRRGVYVHWQRQFLHPMLKAFDAPSREECTAERPRSNTPTAALVLLNDPTFVEAARAFAERILREGGSTEAERIDFACREALSRKPTSAEIAVVSDLRKASEARYAGDSKAASQLIAVGDTPVPADLKPTELAAWTMVARAILNLNETITRN
ncbi:MAG: DUF1549 and DUF1553 domain-containing protein, partial [Pirellulales bacterium]|nr:DUF1549 and DUF1553 domain-containing protein [Pirellulales bacterium]